MPFVVSAGSRGVPLRHAILPLLVAAAVAASGCPSHQSELKSSSVTEGEIATAIASLQLGHPSRQPAKGQFRFHTDSGAAFRNSPRNDRFANNEQLLRQIIAGINSQITLPHDIEVAFSNCYVPESSYDDENHQITICRGLVDDFYHLYSRRAHTQEQRNQAIEGTMAALLLHE